MHKAELVKGSIQNLGANGIAFSVECCKDHATRQRHTIVHAHTFTTAELTDVIERQYCRPAAEAHEAAELNHRHLVNMSKPDVSDCEGCK